MLCVFGPKETFSIGMSHTPPTNRNAPLDSALKARAAGCLWVHYSSDVVKMLYFIFSMQCGR